VELVRIVRKNKTLTMHNSIQSVSDPLQLRFRWFNGNQREWE